MSAFAWFVRGRFLLLLTLLPILSAGPAEDAEALLRGGKIAEAEAAFSAVLAAQPNHVAALIGRARVRQKLGRNTEARADFDEAVRLAPKSFEALLRRALFHEATSDNLAHALGDYNAIVALTPDNATAYQLRGDFLLRAAAWHLQASRLGGLSPDTRRMLRAETAQVKKQFAATRPGTSAAEPDVITSPAAPPRKQLSPGTRLVRDWNGRSHVVDVLEEGFAFEGRLHKSLTAIARQITGAHWSGPRFFGL